MSIPAELTEEQNRLLEAAGFTADELAVPGLVEVSPLEWLAFGEDFAAAVTAAEKVDWHTA